MVGYEKDVEAAMSYVFGGSFVCDTQNNAKTVRCTSNFAMNCHLLSVKVLIVLFFPKVTFDPKIRSRCVTLDGDSFDPAGTLTGGNVDDMNKISFESFQDAPPRRMRN